MHALLRRHYNIDFT
jgi:hypothetical protein